MSRVYLASPTRFRYNIWSDTLNDYIFAKDINDATATVEVPDGRYRLELYQTGSITSLIEDSVLAEAYNVSSNERLASKYQHSTPNTLHPRPEALQLEAPDSRPCKFLLKTATTWQFDDENVKGIDRMLPPQFAIPSPGDRSSPRPFPNASKA